MVDSDARFPLWLAYIAILIIDVAILRWRKVNFGPLYLSWYRKKLRV